MENDNIRIAKPVEALEMNTCCFLTITFQYPDEIFAPVDIRWIMLEKFWIFVAGQETDIQIKTVRKHVQKNLLSVG